LIESLGFGIRRFETPGVIAGTVLDEGPLAVGGGDSALTVVGKVCDGN
jgi:hypothetical protein